MTRQHRAGWGLAALVATSAALVGLGLPSAVASSPQPVEPAELARGDNPHVVHMVGNTIRDGDLAVPATRRHHEALWRTAQGYLLKDRGSLPDRISSRLVRVDQEGGRLLLTRAARSVAVSPDGTRVAWSVELGREGPPVRVTVANPDTGRVVARRLFRDGVQVTAVTRNRVLVSRLFTARRGTAWWNVDRDRLRRIADLSAVGADIRQDRIVLDIPRDAPACDLVAPLSDPSRELWRNCRLYPHAWSPDGQHVLATHTYFDDSGTDRWLVLDATTWERVGRVLGRLDWDSAWEDSRHFLTKAQSASGDAAVIRCTLRGRCERASRLWDLGPVDYQPNYLSPPVVLPSR